VTTEQIYEHYLNESFKRARIHVAANEAARLCGSPNLMLDNIEAAFAKEYPDATCLIVFDEADGFLTFRVKGEGVDELTVHVRRP